MARNARASGHPATSKRVCGVRGARSRCFRCSKGGGPQVSTDLPAVRPTRRGSSSCDHLAGRAAVLSAPCEDFFASPASPSPPCSLILREASFPLSSGTRAVYRVHAGTRIVNRHRRMRWPDGVSERAGGGDERFGGSFFVRRRLRFDLRRRDSEAGATRVGKAPRGPSPM